MCTFPLLSRTSNPVTFQVTQTVYDLLKCILGSQDEKICLNPSRLSQTRPLNRWFRSWLTISKNMNQSAECQTPRSVTVTCSGSFLPASCVSVALIMCLLAITGHRPRYPPPLLPAPPEERGDWPESPRWRKPSWSRLTLAPGSCAAEAKKNKRQINLIRHSARTQCV